VDHLGTGSGNHNQMKNQGGMITVLLSLVAIDGASWLVWTILFVVSAAKTSGMIVDMERSISPKGAITFNPIFEFRDASGIIHTHRTFFSCSFYNYAPGSQVIVLYDVSEPTRAEIDSFLTIWFGPLLATGFGLLFTGFAYRGIFNRRQTSTREG
jgi:hypothetical protein